MFCKHCGKQIANDSTFCQHCGGKVDSIESEGSVSSASEAELNESGEEDVFEEEQVEVYKKATNSSSTIANEIVGNIKMIGVAFILFSVYMLGFIIVHSKDAQPLDDIRYWGASCYDPQEMSSEHMFNWQQHYAKRVCEAPNYAKRIRPASATEIDDMIFANHFEPIGVGEYSLILGMKADAALTYAKMKAKEKGLPQGVMEGLIEEAKKDAQKDKEDFCNQISSIRKFKYEEDMKNNAIYSGIICLLSMILGRYIIKLIKWVSLNKTVC